MAGLGRLWGIPFGIGIGLGIIMTISLLAWLHEPRGALPLVVEQLY